MTNNKKIIFFVIMGFAWACFSLVVQAKESTIKLKDGSTLKGEIIDGGAGYYKINTTTMGIVTLKAEDVMAVQEQSVDKWDEYQKKIVNSPETMASIKNLSDNQDVADILADKNLKDAIIRQDVDYLKNNEKFIKFMNNPTVKQIIKNTTDSNTN